MLRTNVIFLIPSDVLLDSKKYDKFKVYLLDSFNLLSESLEDALLYFSDDTISFSKTFDMKYSISDDCYVAMNLKNLLEFFNINSSDL